MKLGDIEDKWYNWLGASFFIIVITMGAFFLIGLTIGVPAWLLYKLFFVWL